MGTVRTVPGEVTRAERSGSLAGPMVIVPSCTNTRSTTPLPCGLPIYSVPGRQEHVEDLDDVALQPVQQPQVERPAGLRPAHPRTLLRPDDCRGGFTLVFEQVAECHAKRRASDHSVSIVGFPGPVPGSPA